MLDSFFSLFNPIIIFFFYVINTTVISFAQYTVTMTGSYFIFMGILFILVITLIWHFSAIVFSGTVISCNFVFYSGGYTFPELTFSLYLDLLSYAFMLLVVIIGFATNFYILNYFKNEAQEGTFTILINFFIISMIILVLAGNTVTLFLGWELIGLTSYFLINFWNERKGTFKASFKAFSFNKISDFCLLFFIISMWYLTNSTNLNIIQLLCYTSVVTDQPLIKWAIWSLIICCSVKSAQFIGHLWLPDSMEAPVPASALIHSATLVSAGVYLLLRFNYLLYIFDFYYIIICLGSITAAYGAIVAAAQTDVKKLLAYSTISHCGFLFVCVGLNNLWLTLAYLYLHGLYKAATFFCVGTFIRFVNTQDSRGMGQLSRLLPMDAIFLIISASNLGGLPFTLGFLYKQLFFAVNLSSLNFELSFCFCILGMVFSVVYTYRLLYYVLFDVSKYNTSEMYKILQTNPTWDINTFSFSTITQLIGFMILFLFSILSQSIFYYLNYKFVLGVDFYDFNSFNIPNSFNISAHYFESIYWVFYCLYAIVVIIIVFICGRSQFEWSSKVTLLFSSLITISLIAIVCIYV